jgi:ATP-dependent DNA helicase PIF1
MPYNPCLLRTFNCHINVEACGSIKSVKYLFKYIYKGHDRASVVMRETDKADEKGNIDEIKQYRDPRWVTPSEALWRIYGFDLSKNHPPVQQLQLHLPDMHMVLFHKRDKVEQIVNRPGVEDSMLTAYIDANRHHEKAREILYRDFPEHFTWQTDGKFWQKRKNSIFQVGRVISAHPTEGERYFLRVLLNNIAGATSYEDLRTVDGVLLPSFHEAAERRGLIEEDNTLDECLTEATLFQMPSSLQRLFATILIFCEPHDVMGLWIKHYDAMSEDYSHNNSSPDLVQQMVLIDIRNMLQSMGKDIRSFSLPDIDHSYDDASHIPREIFEEASIEQNPKDVLLCDSLNAEQRSAYDEIMTAVCSKQDGLFFVDGPGETGKTFLYRTLLAKLRSQDKLAMATATSGVAAAIMPGGRTPHSCFKIPLTLQEGGCCSFTK